MIRRRKNICTQLDHGRVGDHDVLEAVESITDFAERDPELSERMFDRPLQERDEPRIEAIVENLLFAVMTRQRNEIAREGSRDGKTWLPYGFRYKPGPLDAAPAFAGPHMPRLDWQLWFAALRGCARASWFHAFLRQVLLGESAVLDLLAENPFPDDPPRFLRTPFASYRFAPPGGDTWWTAEPLGEFCPTVTLSDGRLVSVQI